MGTKKCVEWGFGYGESEYEISFGLARRNGELSPSDPKTPEPFNSPFRSRNPERTSDSNSPQNVGSVGQNLGSRGIYTRYPEIKGQWLNRSFFFENGEWRNWIFFFLLVTCEVWKNILKTDDLSSGLTFHIAGFCR